MVIKTHGLLEFCNHQNLRHPSELVREFLSPQELASPAASCLYGPLRYDLASTFSCHDNQNVEVIRGCSKTHSALKRKPSVLRSSSLPIPANKSSRTTKYDLLCPITSSNRRVLKTIFELRRERALCPYRILISCVVSSISFPYLYLCAFVTVQAHWKIRFHNILSMNSTWLLFFELHLSNNGKFFLHSYRNSVTVAQKFLSEILLTLSDIFV